jgi:hypothetical protein
MILTVAPGMTAPVASVTAPLMVPKSPCAAALPDQKLPIVRTTAIAVSIDLVFVMLISKMSWL